MPESRVAFFPARAARPAPPTRGCASPPSGSAQAERIGTVELEQVGQKLELLGEFGRWKATSGPRGDDTRVRLVICLPTYNERANIEPIARRLGDVLESVDAEPRLLVIDDSSPDGTGELADRLSGELGFLSVLHRTRKEGLGPAYVAGFRWALDHGADRIVQMDADFSHDPADLPRLLGATESAGRRPRPRLPLRRRRRHRELGQGEAAISRFGSFYARTILGVPVRDLTGGFKCWRREALEDASAGPRPNEGLRVPDRNHLSRDSRRPSKS